MAEDGDGIYMLEPKAVKDLNSGETLAKKAAAAAWCRNASGHAKQYGGKEWRYALIAHDQIRENMTLAGVVRRFGAS